ncbi:hypothetical protein SAMN05660337_2628 [Maridesulfovibrio ferrireducens]|uniref:Uncharacterized protein n=1 Tax=Maridesulfovibrio ferrireducens TaxID=246191 RepID=A0A1G9J3E8_9BACT|nr:hypothetical protein [Maridesulfovibrio ferrireducens]SDL32020.1 hypothetical protein SAMN05660337_2628 [Maridesulfovibrio ferrireducens]
MSSRSLRIIVNCLISCMIVIVMVCSAFAGEENNITGMLVANGKKCNYIAEQAEGKVYIVYADGERILLAEGFGVITGLAVSPNESLYVFSQSKKRLFRIDQRGKVQMVKKMDEAVRAILVDRDGVVRFVTDAGESFTVQ